MEDKTLIKRYDFDDKKLDDQIREICEKLIVSSLDKTADYNVRQRESVMLLDGSSNTVTADIPLAANNRGKIFFLVAKDVSNAVKVDCEGSDTIGGSADYTYTVAGEAIMISADGVSNWTILSTNNHTGLVNIGTNTHAQIDTHIASTANPHSVTAAQTGAAPAAEGVTNGNSHDHSGGDGAQINHTTLSNIGTNTHAQIDTHVGSTANPHTTTDANLSTSDVTTNNGSTSKHGFMPKAPNDATQGISGVDGTWGIVGYSPIGSITAWHKSFASTPALPSNWVECNGQTLSDADSVYNGQVIPDLNGGARFLRGSSTSGTMQGFAMQGHRHNVRRGDGQDLYANDGAGASQLVAYFSTLTGTVNSSQIESRELITDGINGTPVISTETRPVNMSVVWIMRIK